MFLRLRSWVIPRELPAWREVRQFQKGWRKKDDEIATDTRNRIIHQGNSLVNKLLSQDLLNSFISRISISTTNLVDNSSSLRFPTELTELVPHYPRSLSQERMQRRRMCRGAGECSSDQGWAGSRTGWPYPSMSSGNQRMAKSINCGHWPSPRQGRHIVVFLCHMPWATNVQSKQQAGGQGREGWGTIQGLGPPASPPSPHTHL